MDVEQAKLEVNQLYEYLYPVAEDIVNKYSREIDTVIKRISKAQTLTNNELRENMLELSIESYTFGIYKDSSILKQDCATTLMKEGMAKSYNATGGTQLIRTNQSIIDTVDKQVVNLLYTAVANMMKTKLDEAHRIVNTLNSILISRNAEAKMINGKSEIEEITKKPLMEDGEQIIF